jgi:hypothetical protein
MRARRRTIVLSGVVASALVTSLAAVVPMTSAPTAAATAVDRADTRAAALRSAAERQGRWLRETLTAGDVDWFRYRLASPAPVSVTLGGLPGDYDLAVFDGTGRQRAASTRSGRTFDEVWLRLPAGDVLVRVTRKRGAASGTYSLRLRTFSPAVHVLSVQRTTTRGVLIGEFYNATSKWRAVSELNVTWLDSTGRVVHRTTTSMAPATWLRPWGRVPFTVRDQVTGAQERRTVSMRVRPSLVTEDDAPRLAPLTARITRTVTWPRTATNPGGRTYEGKVSTNARSRVPDVRVHVSEYDAYGTLQVLGLSEDVTTLPARGSRRWRGSAEGRTWAPPSLVVVRAYESLGG